MTTLSKESTSDFAGDVLFGGDDLVHVSAYGGLQRRAACLAALHDGLVLGLGLGLHQPVHCIRDLGAKHQSNNRSGTTAVPLSVYGECLQKNHQKAQLA